MFNRSNNRNLQSNQEQELVPLTPEVAREIEKLLIKNAETLENLKARYNAGRGTKKYNSRHLQRNSAAVEW